jgi:hypothetical protein
MKMLGVLGLSATQKFLLSPKRRSRFGVNVS